MRGILAAPRPCNLLFHGPTGCGKTTMGMAFAEQLPGSLIHIPAQQCNVARVDQLALDMMYVPPRGKFWIPLVDEADQMTEKAQLQLLSRMDGTAKLRATWGHGYTVGEIPPVIYIFTCNSMANFESRFPGRCMVIPFEPIPQAAIAKYLAKIWKRERGREGLPLEWFHEIADGLGVRDALNRLDVELLRNPTVREVKKALADKKAKAEALENAEVNQWTAAAKAVEQVV